MILPHTLLLWTTSWITSAPLTPLGTRWMRSPSKAVRSRMDLALVLRELVARQDGVVRPLRQLVCPQLGGEPVLPGVAVLGVVDDLAAHLVVVDHLVDHVGAVDALGHALDAVAFEGGAISDGSGSCPSGTCCSTGWRGPPLAPACLPSAWWRTRSARRRGSWRRR